MITLEDVCNYLGHCSLEDGVLENLNEFFNPKGEILGFSPSSIAVHPITGHLYITSSKGKMILVLSPDGKILHIEKLQKPIHPQPEGLCFEKDGTMWISNEAKKAAPARVYQFKMQN
jgi:DNA-binding beta-propeller fold protein YncE